MPIDAFPLPSPQILAETTVLLSCAVVPLALRSRPATSRHHCRSAAATSRPFIAILTAYYCILLIVFAASNSLHLYFSPLSSHSILNSTQYFTILDVLRWHHSALLFLNYRPSTVLLSQPLCFEFFLAPLVLFDHCVIRPPFYEKPLRCRIGISSTMYLSVQFVHICHLTHITSYLNTQMPERTFYSRGTPLNCIQHMGSATGRAGGIAP